MREETGPRRAAASPRGRRRAGEAAANGRGRVHTGGGEGAGAGGTEAPRMTGREGCPIGIGRCPIGIGGRVRGSGNDRVLARPRRDGRGACEALGGWSGFGWALGLRGGREEVLEDAMEVVVGEEVDDDAALLAVLVLDDGDAGSERGAELGLEVEDVGGFG